MNHLARAIAIPVLCLALDGCAPAVVTAEVAKSLEVKKFAIPCEDGFRFAAQSLRTNKYEVTAVDRGPSGGTLTGNREDNGTVVTVECAADGVSATASGGGKWAEGGLRVSFEKIAGQGDAIWPPPKSPRVLLEVVSDVESEIYFPTNLAGLGLTAVRTVIVGGVVGPFRIDPQRMRFGNAAGGSITPLDAKALARRSGAHGSALTGRMLARQRIENRGRAVGFVFLPKGSYRSATVSVVDIETGEADQFDLTL